MDLFNYLADLRKRISGSLHDLAAIETNISSNQDRRRWVKKYAKARSWVKLRARLKEVCSC